MKRNLLTSLLLGLGVVLAGCPSGTKIPGRGGGAASSVDPNTCGNYAATDAGRKLKAFLEATVTLEREVQKTENWVRDSCAAMGAKLGMSGLQGTTKETCNRVLAELRNHLQVGLKAGAKLSVKYTPARCEVKANLAASAAAKCEAKAAADISVRCTGQCTGTCSGTCQGQCSGSGSAGGGGAAASGQCNGQCEGTCQGSCSGGCTGNADVQASAECEARAEVEASAHAECTEPKVEVTYDAGVVVDASKIAAAKAAIETGLPRLLRVGAQIGGPVKFAAVNTLKTGQNLVAAGYKLYRSLGDQAACVAGQIKAAVNALAAVQVSVEVQVEVSASASTSAGASGGASGSAGASAGTAAIDTIERILLEVEAAAPVASN